MVLESTHTREPRLFRSVSMHASIFSPDLQMGHLQGPPQKCRLHLFAQPLILLYLLCEVLSFGMR